MSSIHNRGMGITVLRMITLEGNWNGHVKCGYITG